MLLLLLSPMSRDTENGTRRDREKTTVEKTRGMTTVTERKEGPVTVTKKKAANRGRNIQRRA